MIDFATAVWTDKLLAWNHITSCKESFGPRTIAINKLTLLIHAADILSAAKMTRLFKTRWILTGWRKKSECENVQILLYLSSWCERALSVRERVVNYKN